MSALTITGQAAGTGTTGIVVTDTPATYHDGKFTCSRLQFPGILLSPTLGWLAVRVKIGDADSVDDPQMVASIAGSSGGGNKCGFFDNVIYTRRSDGIAPAEVDSLDYEPLAGDSGTFVAAWDATHIKVSVNGGAFLSAASTGIPAGLVSLGDLGMDVDQTQVSQMTYLWAAFGKGSVADSDAAALNTLGDTPPTLTTVAGTSGVADMRAGGLSISTPVSGDIAGPVHLLFKR